MPDSKPGQVRKPEPSLPQAFPITPAGSACDGDVPKRIGALVAIGGRIGSTATPDRIQHKQKCTRHEIELSPQITLSD
jgi:hypothetical protein